MCDHFGMKLPVTCGTSVLILLPISSSAGLTAHQGMGSCTGDITPILCIYCNSDCTFDLSGRGILHGALRANGLWLGLSSIVYACANVPSPVNKAGYYEMILFQLYTHVTTFLVS